MTTTRGTTQFSVSPFVHRLTSSRDRVGQSRNFRRLWLEELADGAFRDVLEEIPSNFTGQMLVTW